MVAATLAGRMSPCSTATLLHLAPSFLRATGMCLATQESMTNLLSGSLCLT